MSFKPTTLRRLTATAVSAVVGLALSSSIASAVDLTVYTAVEAEDLKKYASRFNEEHPDINIKWVRDSTGIVTAKLLAEKDNPQADIIWGLAATSLLLMKGEGMLEAYAPAGLDKLNPKFVDKDNPPYWTGMDAWVAAICVNTVESEKHGLPMPASWKDLTKPEYKGHVADQPFSRLVTGGLVLPRARLDPWSEYPAIRLRVGRWPLRRRIPNRS